MHYTSARVSKRGNRHRAFLSFKDEAGTSRQVSKTLDARGISQAKRELAAWRAEMEARADAEDRKGVSGREAASMAVPDYVDRYVDAAESARTVEQSTIKGYRSSAKLIRREFSDAKVGELTTEMVADWEARLTEGGMSSSSVGKAHRLLKMIMQQAVFAQAVDRNPLDFVKPPKRRNVKPGINALDRQGRAEMLSKLGELELTEVTVAALISIYTGLREGEVCGLQWRDVDMQKKETLISFPDGKDADKDVSFVFSHSALKEGWDNPNVFQICTLVETKDNLTKRQKIGRGLRLCVNQDGERLYDPEANVLTVIANESYDDFANGLQKELEAEDFRFGIITPESFTKVTVKTPEGVEERLGYEKSKQVYDHLVATGMVDGKGAVTPELKAAAEEGKVELPAVLEPAKEQVEAIIIHKSQRVQIRDKAKEVSVELQKDVTLDPAFQAL